MATPSPFSFVSALPRQFAPPAWATDEIKKRVVLLLNHVLMQEPEATARLVRKKGQVALVKWRDMAVKFVVTPAGLLDLAADDAEPQLTLEVMQQSPVEIFQALLKGDKPEIRIEGDVQLAAEINWLVDHVRWDVEEDFARIIGDVPARAIGKAAQRFGDALKQFVRPASGSGGKPA